MKDTLSSKPMASNEIVPTALESDDLKTERSFLDPKKWEKEGILIESHPISSCEKVKEFRGNLIANVSHDLRTPLQSITGYAETMLLKQGHLSAEEQKNYLHIILESANKLSGMINQFFEYSKLEVSQVEPDCVPFSVEKIIKELQQNYGLITTSKQINLVIHAEANLAPVCGDYLMIYRVFQNLIDNALKFTPHNGTVTVDFSTHSTNQLQVAITDTGTGIPSKELDAIFNKFQMTQETAYDNGRNDGMGLGLAIVRKILSLHDAQIFVQSELGVGTTFTFYLPFH
ncbi:MAG: HAMP domain-containing sensor histidine kinase [Bacteroidota bacterium]